jgi:hypothetical protein
VVIVAEAVADFVTEAVPCAVAIVVWVVCNLAAALTVVFAVVVGAGVAVPGPGVGVVGVVVAVPETGAGVGEVTGAVADSGSTSMTSLSLSLDLPDMLASYLARGWLGLPRLAAAAAFFWGSPRRARENLANLAN